MDPERGELHCRCRAAAAAASKPEPPPMPPLPSYVEFTRGFGTHATSLGQLGTSRPTYKGAVKITSELRYEGRSNNERNYSPNNEPALLSGRVSTTERARARLAAVSTSWLSWAGAGGLRPMTKKKVHHKDGPVRDASRKGGVEGAYLGSPPPAGRDVPRTTPAREQQEAHLRAPTSLQLDPPCLRRARIDQKNRAWRTWSLLRGKKARRL